MLSCVAALVVGYHPYVTPPWAATYNMSMSTMNMACNSSGWYDPVLGGSFGITSYDWSNAKAQWANAKPMDCEERLVEQAVRTKRANPATHVFVYRNLVKALPWFTSVREKLDDPQYSGFFLKFKDGVNGSYHVPQCTAGKCSEFYHDQLQTPEHPDKEHPHPDGACKDQCDCGKNPCGEYLWDHRNGTMLREFLINEHILGKNGIGHPAIDGLFIDDFWCAHQVNGSGACHDPVQGPSEVDAHNQADMGLSDADVADITREYLKTMTAAQTAILAAKAYTWSLIPGEANANAMPKLVDHTTCAAQLEKWCTEHPFEGETLLFGLKIANNVATQLMEDMAAFLLVRGPYAYLGAGAWGMGWPMTMARPAAMDTDYGSPLGLCKQTAPLVFEREYTKASVKLSCSTFKGEITMK